MRNLWIDIPVREMDVCLHLPTRRRVLAVTVLDGTARCVTNDDQFFECRTAELIPYRHPKFSEAVRIAAQTDPPA